jgi:HAD superfamily hydrolase (TIGR01509 family)
MAASIRAVVFDLDGVLIDSEGIWDVARRQLAAEHGAGWPPGATEAMQGMSSPEWSRYLRDTVGIPLSEAEIVERVVDLVLRRYEAGLPLLPGALQAVEDLRQRWPLGLASSANPAVIDRVLELANLRAAFGVTVSSEEVPRGKPAPDVYLEATRRLGIPPRSGVAVEDSTNGIRSGVAAGLRVVAIPRPDAPPTAEVLATASLVLRSLEELGAPRLEELERSERLLDEEEAESFPASDPHSDWAGPSN